MNGKISCRLVAMAITAAMLAGLFLVGAGASGYSDGTVIFEEYFENDAIETDYSEKFIKEETESYTSSKYTAFVKADGAFGNDTNHYLLVRIQSSSWTRHTIVGSELLDGCMEYTLRCKIKNLYDADIIYSDILGFCFGTNPASAAGDWCCLRWDTHLTVNGYEYDGASGIDVEGAIAPQSANDLYIEVNHTDRTMKVYINGYLFRTVEGISGTPGSISLVAGKTMFAIDDICVTAGTLEDAGIAVETLVTTEPTEPVERPDTDYTGKKAGEIIYSEDFNGLTDFSECYWKSLNNASFESARVRAELSELDSSACAKLTGISPGSWGAFEVLPEGALDTYTKYTVQLKVNIENQFNRFSIMYNCPDNSSTENCGLYEMRWYPVTVRNQGIVNGESNAYSDLISDIEFGTTFTLTLEIDRDLGVTYSYINGEFFNFAAGICTQPGGIYLVCQSLDTSVSTVYVDDVTVSCGTFDEFKNGGAVVTTVATEDNKPGSTETPTTETPTTDTPTTDTPTTDKPGTEAPETKPADVKGGGCGGFASFMSLAALAVTSVGAAVVFRRKS